MNRSERELGMDRAISRRDFLNGVGVVAASTLMPGCSSLRNSDRYDGARATDGYPPARMGLRGSHPGSFEVAHQLAFAGRSDWGPVQEPDPDLYDLIVVGAGISGLAAAHFFRQHEPNARILILDNHDDFGGHAKRNEFKVGDRSLIGYGGSQTLEDPYDYSDVTKALLYDIGIRLERFESAYDKDFYRRHGLRGGVYFDRETYGVDRLVPYEIVAYSRYLPVVLSTLSPREAVAQMPLSESGKRDLLKLLEADESLLADLPRPEQRRYLRQISYRDYLMKHLNITAPEVFTMLENMATDVSLGIDTASAGQMMGYVGLPGLSTTDLHRDDFDDNPYIYHFPDGNASVARLLVRSMIPRVAPGDTMEDVVTAKFDYGRLDEADSRVRLRLNSTAVHVANEGGPANSKRVSVSYVRHGRAYRVWGRTSVIAGYNAMIPYLCPEFPETQREALSEAVKSPIIYTNVLLRNWQAWKKLGIGAMAAPGSYHANAMLDFPVSLGDYVFSANPDEPILVHLERFAKRPDAGPSTKSQYRAIRHDMLKTPFETIERGTRAQLAGALAQGGFDPARDILGITTNRWAHGYASFYFSRDGGMTPNLIGRKRFGRITIANSDAGARPVIHSAIDQAYRAVGELVA